MATYSRKIGSVSSHYLYQPGSYADATITVYLDVTYTQNATNNTTSTYARIRVTNNNTSVPYQITSWSISGTGSTGSGSDSTMSTYSATRNLTATSTKTINHGTDGTCSFTNGATVKIKYYSGTGTSTTTSTLTLSNAVYTMPTIEVHSTLAFSTTTPTMGSSVTMTITKASCATSGVRIQATYDNTTTTIYENTGASYAWTVPNLATTTTDALTKAITITIQSKKGTTYYEPKTYTLTASVPSSYVPSVSIGTVTQNLSVSSFIIGYSKLTIPLTGSTSNDGGATIVSYAIEVRETNSSGTLLYSASASNTGTSQSFSMASVVTTATTYIKATITDSRGRTATATTTKTAIAYTKPSIVLLAQRCNSDQTLNPLGTYCLVTLTWSFQQIGSSNSLATPIRVYRSFDGSTYTQYATRNPTAGTYSGTYTFKPALAIDEANWWIAEVADTVMYETNSSVRAKSNTAVATKGTVALSLYDDGSNVGMCVGQIATGSGMEVTLEATHTKRIFTSFKNSVAMGSMQSSQTTVDGLANELRYSSGVMGSANITTAYTKDGITISTGWYNFIYSPHRSGGVDGTASGDNCNYGNLIMLGMTVGGIFRVRIDGGAIAELSMLEGADYVVANTTMTTTGLATTWTVRKWNSGYCEAFAVTNSTGYPMTQAYTNGYYYAATQALPTGLFTAVTYGQVERCGGSSAGGLISASLYNLETTRLQWYAFDTRSETVNCSFAIRIVGTWK